MMYDCQEWFNHELDILSESCDTLSQRSYDQEHQQKHCNVGSHPKEHSGQIKFFLAVKRRFRDFCEEFKFSLRAKIFVTKLNIRAGLDLIRGFVNSRLIFFSKTRLGLSKLRLAKELRGREHIIRLDAPHRSTNGYLFNSENKPLVYKHLNRIEDLPLMNHMHSGRNSTYSDNSDTYNRIEGRINKSRHRCSNSYMNSRNHIRYSSSNSFPVTGRQYNRSKLWDEVSTYSSKSDPEYSSRSKNRTFVGQSNMNRIQVTNVLQAKLCIVCYDNPANITTLPCNHSDICSRCILEVLYVGFKNHQFPLKCVLCRRKIERIRCSKRIYRNEGAIDDDLGMDTAGI